MSKQGYQEVLDYITNKKEASKIILMSEDELDQETVETYGGVYIKNMGDGALVIYVDKQSKRIAKLFTKRDVFVVGRKLSKNEKENK